MQDDPERGECFQHKMILNTRPGLYHINAVDTVTQWQVVGCCQTISEAHLLPVLEAILHQFPFRIRGFHSDNGSEFLNLRVAKLLHKLLIAEFTKSRAHRTTDNALVEGKNGAVVRKHIGHEPIAAEHAAEFQRFYTAWFNPYLNFHRPCGFATVEVSEQGKRRRHYRLEDYRTPYEKLVSLDEWEQHLKPGITADFLEQQTQRMSDTECARNMQQRKRKAAGPVPLPLVNPRTTGRGLAAPDSAGMGGGGGSSTNAVDQGHTRLRFPPPSNTLRKEIHTQRWPLARPTPFQDHSWIGKC